jgi:hypothetical protein
VEPLIILNSGEQVADEVEELDFSDDFTVTEPSTGKARVALSPTETTSGYNPFSEFQSSGGDSVSTGNAGLLHLVTVSDGASLEVYQATLTLSDGSPAPTDLDLDLIELDGQGGGTYLTSVLQGDGSTSYVETKNTDPKSDPLVKYTNTSGSEMTIAIYVNNGDFGQSGTGSLQNVFASVIGEVV